MAQPTKNQDAAHEPVRLPPGVVLKPPVTIDDLRADTEVAGEFVALIRSLRREPTRSTPL